MSILNSILIGRHVSVAGGVQKAPERAAAIGCNCFQIFSRSPRGGAASKLTPQIIGDFQANMKKFKQKLFVIHTPYYINLASKNNRIRHGSIEVIRDELERGSRLGAYAVMTHIGSAKEYERREDAIEVVVDSLISVLRGYKGTTRFLLENAAGAGDVLGVGFEELAEIIESVGRVARDAGRGFFGASLVPRTPSLHIGICLDTCHVFASGYDIRTKSGVDKMVKEFDRVIGLNRLSVIHVNDSKADFKSHRDRHEHIGEGKIGVAGFRAILRHQKLKKLLFILETPEDSRGDERDVEMMRKLAG